MRLSFDTNNYFHTPPFHSVWSLFCFSGLFHSTAGPPRVLYLAKRVTTSRYSFIKAWREILEREDFIHDKTTTTVWQYF